VTLFSMKLSIPSDRFGTEGARRNRGWVSDQFSDPNAPWEAFLQLWERANLLRSFIWTQESADEKTFFKQFLARARRFFSVDFCFVALFVGGEKILQLSLPEDGASNLPANFVRHALDLIANSRAPVTWKQLGKDSGLKSVVVSPLLAAVGQPLGFFMLGHMQPKNFSRSELFLLQLLAGDLSWAIRELRSRQNHQRQLTTLSHELKNSLNVIMGDCALLREDLERSLDAGERRELSDIETMSQEILNLINSFLDSSPSCESNAGIAGDNIELVPLIEDALMSHRTKAQSAGCELQIDYAKDLPQEIATDSVRFRHVVRNLANYAMESVGQYKRRIYVKKNGAMLELTVSGVDAREHAEAGGASRWNGSCSPEDTVSPTRLELIKEHVEFLRGHVHVVSPSGEKSDITVCLPYE
jgi:signal transduction histidine kinase